jgi:hypothetical protein
MKLSLPPKLMVFLVSRFTPPLSANVLFAGFFLNLSLCMTKLRVLVLCFFSFTDNSNIFGNLANLNVLKKNPMLLAPCFSPQNG